MAITAAQLQVLIGADTSGAEKGMNAVSRSLQSFGADAMKVGGVLSAAVTAPLMILGKQAVDAATNLDREMRNIQSISKATDDEIAALSETFVSMSMDITKTTDSAANLAAGFYDIQGSGFAGADGMKVLEASTKAASAGLTDTAVASRAITATLNAYGMGAEEATRVSDVLFRTMDIGVLTFEELATNLGDVVGTAAIAGVSIEELGAGYATMTKAGISAAESSTALNQLMLSFISPSKEAAKAAAALGVDLSAAALQSKGLGGAMADVMRATGGNVEALSDLFPNVRALKAALSLTREDMGPFAADLEAIGGAAGATAAAFEIQSKSFAAQMKTFSNTLEGLKISIGQIVLPILTELMNRIKPLLDRFMNLDDGTKRIIVVLGILAAAAGPVLLAIGSISMVLGALLSPVGLVVAAIAALGVAFATNFLGIRDIAESVFAWLVAQVQAVWPTIQSIITTVIQTIHSVVTTVLSAIQAFWQQHGEQILSFAQTTWEWISSFIALAIENIRAIVESVMSMVQAFWAENGAQIMEAAQIVWSRIQQVVSTVVNILWTVISTVMSAVQAFWREHGDTMLTLAQNAWNIIRTVVETVINAIFGIIKTVVALIRGDWEGAWNAIQDILATVWGGMSNIVTTVISSIDTVIGDTLRGIWDGWKSRWEDIANTVRTIWQQIVDTIKGKINNIIDLMNVPVKAWNALGFHIPGFSVSLPSVDVPGIGRVGGGNLGWGGINIETPDLPTIPRLAEGGIVTRPTLAVLGERGPEAVVPLSRAWSAGAAVGVGIDYERLGAAVAEAMRAHPTYQLTANYRYQDEREVRDDLRLLQMLGAAT